MFGDPKNSAHPPVNADFRPHFLNIDDEHLFALIVEVMAATSVNPTGALKLSSPVRFDTALKISRQLFHPYCLRRVLQAGLSGDSPLPQVTTGRADSCFAAHLPSRLRLSDPERFTLAEIGKRLGRKRLKHVTAKPDTILAWYRRLIARKFDGSKHRTYPGVMEGNPTSRQKKQPQDSADDHQ